MVGERKKKRKLSKQESLSQVFLKSNTGCYLSERCFLIRHTHNIDTHRLN